MKKILSVTIVVSLILTLSFTAFAGSKDIAIGSGSTGAYAKIGMSGGQFLKIGHGARGNAMAGSVSALTNDLASVFWNPAGVAEITALTAEFDYTRWFGNMNHNYAAVGLPLSENFSFAVHFTGLSTDKMERTTIERPDGLNSYFTANDISVGMSIAGYLTDQFSFGITARYLNNSIASASASGVSFDVGTKYKTGIQGITLGVSLHGLTTQLTYSGNEFNRTYKPFPSSWASPLDVTLVSNPFDIPLVFRANVAGDIYKKDEHALVAALDFTTTSDSPEQFALGAEYVWNDLLAVRAGYRMGHDVQGFSGGIGLKYFTGSFTGKIDYSISPLANDLGLINRISIAIDLGNKQ